MAIEFEKKPIPWKEPGSVPSDELQTSGFQAGYKPAAQTFNALFNNTSECLTELQNSVSGIDTELEDFVRFAHSEETPSTPILTDSNLLEGQPASYYTNASNITSGVLSVEHGGTGATTPSAALSNLHGVEKTTGDIKYYVNASTGSDTNNGLSASTAFKTIQHAIDILPKRIEHPVTIEVAAGAYDFVTIQGFDGGNVITVQGTSTENCVVNGVLARDNSARVMLWGLTGTPSPTGNKAAFEVNGATHLRVHGCIARGTGVSGEKGFNAVEGGVLYLLYCKAYDIENGVVAGACGWAHAGGMAGSGVTNGYWAQDGGIIQEGHYWGVTEGYTCTTKYYRERSGILVKEGGTLAT